MNIDASVQFINPSFNFLEVLRVQHTLGINQNQINRPADLLVTRHIQKLAGVRQRFTDQHTGGTLKPLKLLLQKNTLLTE